jgi:uncharacterized protein (TIGR04255 family)
MNKVENAPLLEAVFELRWGEVQPGSFEYTQDEQQLFPGKFSAAALEKQYGIVKYLQNDNAPKLPYIISHRFFKEEMKWPCVQIGLGIFTVNQVNEGYAWDTFKESIAEGLEVITKADTAKLENIKNTGVIILRYQDAFYPSESETIEHYLEEHFNVSVKLPNAFRENDCLGDTLNGVNVNLVLPSTTPEGSVRIMIANALMNDKPGLMMETLVESKLKKVLEEGDHIMSILNWSESAHDIQRHAFDTLIESSAYARKE